MINLLDEAMDINTGGLFLVVLGPSGAGKSHFIGTYPGKTLMLYGAGESHGPASAVKNNPNLLALAWDRAKNEKGEVVDLTPDKFLKRIKEILEPETLKAAGIECVAIDSLTNLMTDLKKTEAFRQRCMNARGQHNSFKETEALIEMSSALIRQFQTLVDFHGINVITTLDLQIQSIGDDGTILESKPSLPTFGVARAIVQQFPDILMLGRLGETRTPMFQNFAKASSVSTDRESQTVVKYVEYNPRLRGVLEMPETIEASVPAVLELKGLGEAKESKGDAGAKEKVG